MLFNNQRQIQKAEAEAELITKNKEFINSLKNKAAYLIKTCVDNRNAGAYSEEFKSNLDELKKNLDTDDSYSNVLTLNKIIELAVENLSKCNVIYNCENQDKQIEKANQERLSYFNKLSHPAIDKTALNLNIHRALLGLSIFIVLSAAAVLTALYLPEHMPLAISGIVEHLSPLVHDVILGSAYGVGGLGLLAALYEGSTVRNGKAPRLSCSGMFSNSPTGRDYTESNLNNHNETANVQPQV